MAVLDELKFIENRDGILYPHAVVEYAHDPGTSLHKHFEWNNKKAAEQFRLQQARELIRVQVTYLDDGAGQPKEVRAFVSLMPDRAKEGGYRSAVKVWSDTEYRNQLLGDAKRELETFTKKYAGLIELNNLIAEIQRVLEITEEVPELV